MRLQLVALRHKLQPDGGGRRERGQREWVGGRGRAAPLTFARNAGDDARGTFLLDKCVLLVVNIGWQLVDVHVSL